MYHVKYLKYKHKYLELKFTINCAIRSTTTFDLLIGDSNNDNTSNMKTILQDGKVFLKK